MAILAGATHVNTTVNGLGERAGNAALEEVAMALKVLYGYSTGIDARRLPEISALVAQASGRAFAANKSIVGQGVFSHESGIHVDGMLKDPANYQGFDPALVGRQHCLVLGRHSSARGVINAYAGIGIDIDESLVKNILAQVSRFAVRYKRSPTPEDLKNFHTLALALEKVRNTAPEICNVA
jgi:homocitrate synthase NifV